MGYKESGDYEKVTIEKTQWCAFCKEEVRALEVREIDYLPDKIETAKALHDKYYGNENKCLI